MIVQSDTKLRQHDIFPAKQRAKLPAMLERLLGGWQASLQEKYHGITVNGHLASGLYPLRELGISLRPVVDAANSLLGHLTPEQKTKAVLPIDATEWRSWSNVHPFVMRHGLCLDDMTVEQRDAALALLRVTLSDEGYETARGIMKISEHNRELTGRPEEYGEWLYWLSVMGTPSETVPWGWQIDGHHLIINCFVSGSQMVLTPVFMGAEPGIAKIGKYAGTRVLHIEESKGLSFIRALTPEQKKKSSLGPNVPREVFAGAFTDNLQLPYQGIGFRALSTSQQAILFDLIEVYLRRIRPDQGAIKRNEIKAHLAETYFAWMGNDENQSPFYYRVHSPVVLIEFTHLFGLIFDNDEPTRNHIHTTVRTPNGNDYGKELLREYRSQHSRTLRREASS